MVHMSYATMAENIMGEHMRKKKTSLEDGVASEKMFPEKFEKLR